MNDNASTDNIPNIPPIPPIIITKDLNFTYAGQLALQNINVSFKKGKVTAIIGPSGSGKSTLLRCFNRIYELTPKCGISGKIFFENQDILGHVVDVTELRQRIGMVFQKPTPFPMSIEKNITFGLRFAKKTPKSNIHRYVKESLQHAALWDEVKDKLHTAGNYLSGGQQQRLCLARTLAMQPDVLLLDEPTSSLDPISGRKIEDVILELRKKYTVIIVTHNLRQARRISDETLLMMKGQVVEYAPTDQLFHNPTSDDAKRYLEYED